MTRYLCKCGWSGDHDELCCADVPPHITLGVDKWDPIFNQCAQCGSTELEEEET